MLLLVFGFAYREAAASMAGLLGLPRAVKRRVGCPVESRVSARVSAGLTCFKLLARRQRAVCVVVMGEPGAAEALGSRAGPRESVPIRAGEA